MSQNNLFNADDIFEDKKSRGDFTGAIGFIIRAMLAVTTAGFFFEYVGSLYNWVAGPTIYGPYLSALTGVFMIDALAYFWTKLRQQNGNSKTQITAATIGTIGNMGLSVVVTAVFIILQTDFVQIRDAAGNLNELGSAVNTAGFIVATFAFVFNGALWAYFDANSFQAIQALRTAVLTAARAAGIFAVDDRRTRLEIGRTVEELNAALPRYTNDAAARNRTQYLLNNFRDIDADSDGRLTDQEIKAHASQKHPPKEAEKFTVWLCDETGRRVTRHSRTYDTFKEADQLARRMSFELAPGDRTAVYRGDEMIANYTTFDKGSSTAEMTPVNYQSNGRHEPETPPGPEPYNLDVYRQAPGDIEQLIAEEFSSMDEALSYIKRRAGDPPGTRYRIDTYGRTLDTYIKDGVSVSRPTQPQQPFDWE